MKRKYTILIAVLCYTVFGNNGCEKEDPIPDPDPFVQPCQYEETDVYSNNNVGITRQSWESTFLKNKVDNNKGVQNYYTLQYYMCSPDSTNYNLRQDSAKIDLSKNPGGQIYLRERVIEVLETNIGDVYYVVEYNTEVLNSDIPFFDTYWTEGLNVLFLYDCLGNHISTYVFRDLCYDSNPSVYGYITPPVFLHGNDTQTSSILSTVVNKRIIYI